MLWSPGRSRRLGLLLWCFGGRDLRFRLHSGRRSSRWPRGHRRVNLRRRFFAFANGQVLERVRGALRVQWSARDRTWNIRRANFSLPGTEPSSQPRLRCYRWASKTAWRAWLLRLGSSRCLCGVPGGLSRLGRLRLALGFARSCRFWRVVRIIRERRLVHERLVVGWRHVIVGAGVAVGGSCTRRGWWRCHWRGGRGRAGSRRRGGGLCARSSTRSYPSRSCSLGELGWCWGLRREWPALTFWGTTASWVGTAFGEYYFYGGAGELRNDPGQGVHQIRPVAQVHDWTGVAERQGERATVKTSDRTIGCHHGMQNS